jgi:hypothetical protein
MVSAEPGAGTEWLGARGPAERAGFTGKNVGGREGCSCALIEGTEVGAFYWTVPAPDIVDLGREEQGSVLSVLV